jgi:hypothetical protein
VIGGALKDRREIEHVPARIIVPLPWPVRSFDFVIDNFSRFSERLGGGWCRHRRGQLQSVFIIYGDDETGLAREIESVEMVSLGLEDHGLRLPRGVYSVVSV